MLEQGGTAYKSLWEILGKIPDPRDASGRRFSFAESFSSDSVGFIVRSSRNGRGNPMG